MSWVSWNIWSTKVSTSNGTSWNGRSSTPVVLDWLNLSVEPAIASTDMVFAMTPAWVEYMIESQNLPWGGSSGNNPYTGSFPWILNATSSVDADAISYSLTQVWDVLQTDGAGWMFVWPLVDSSFNDVRSATTGNIAALTYNNGAGWVWATLTKATAFTAANLWLWAAAVQIGKDYLIKNQTIQAHNWPYKLTSANVLTRTTWWDNAAELYPQQIRVIYWSNQNTLRSQSTATAITIWTTNIVYVTTPVPAFVTQEATGTQGIYQIPRWTAVTRQLSKWSNKFTFNLPALLLSVFSDIDITKTGSWLYRRFLTSSWLFGGWYAWSGMRAGDTMNVTASSTWAVAIATESWLYQAWSTSPTTTALMTTFPSWILDVTVADQSVWSFAWLSADIGIQSARIMSWYPLSWTSYMEVNQWYKVDISAPWSLRMELLSTTLWSARTNQVVSLTDELSLEVDYKYPSQYNRAVADLWADYTINNIYGNEDNWKTFTNQEATSITLIDITVTLPLSPVNGESYTFTHIEPAWTWLYMYNVVDPNWFKIFNGDTMVNTSFRTNRGWSSITIYFDLADSSWYASSATGSWFF